MDLDIGGGKIAFYSLEKLDYPAWGY